MEEKLANSSAGVNGAEANTRQPISSLTIGIVCILLLAVYLLSPPPLAGALEYVGCSENETVQRVFEGFYAPVIWAYEQLPLVRKFYDGYSELLGLT
jgi:hypothetical protein